MSFVILAMISTTQENK
ncbi:MULTISPECIES: hypothetical protein [Enterobacter]|nr:MULTISPECIES: hypothetical protein [Enterobacter]WJD51231.1 hypothetical protein QRD42_07465 [Enterobacter sp. PGRG2]WNP36837.1 hypothetical protein RN333_19275 [Enterobacter kobei]